MYLLRLLAITMLLIPGYLRVQAQQLPTLVKDFGMLPGTYAGTLGADLNGKFVTDSLGTLLISDGTDTGTHSIKSFYRISAMKVVNGKLFMIACDTLEHGNELWISDGTEAGTYLVKEINPALNASGVMYFIFEDYSIVAFDNKVFFYGNDGTHGVELWKSDGTAAGTIMVKDINTISGADILELSYFPFGAIQASGGKLYFSANDGINGSELWCTDGTPANTHIVKDLIPLSGSGNPRYLTAFNDKLCFWATDGIDSGIYITDGTDTGTHLLATHIFTPNSEQAILNGKLYFFADTPGVVGTSALWCTDGSAAGTAWVSHAFYGTTQYSYKSYLSAFLDTCNGKLCFGAAGNLWESDGVPGSTHLLKDLSMLPGVCNTPTHITNFEGKIYMKATTTSGRVEIIESDGTDTGTHLLPHPGSDFSTTSSFVTGNYLTMPLTVVGTKLFFWNTYKTSLGHSLYVIGQAGLSASQINSIAASVTIFPNPSRDAITITSPVGTHIFKIELLSLEGRLIRSVEVDNLSQVIVHLDENTCGSAGIVRVYTDAGISVQVLTRR
jgi:ELWxxDGT repeat protein